MSKRLTQEQWRKITDRLMQAGPIRRNPRYLSTEEQSRIGISNPTPGVTIAEALRRYAADFAAAEKELREKSEL